MEIAISADVQAQAEGYGVGNDAGVRSGVIVRHWLLNDEALDGLKFRFFRSEYRQGDEAFESPRHHHTFQQIRWTEAGSVNFSPGEDIEQGDIAYFPRGTFYGPQRKDQGVGLLLQFGFGDDYPAGRKDRSNRNQKAMVLADGDAFERVAAADPEAQLRPASLMPDAGYETPILMHPKAYEYYQAAPGVEIKHLGRFYDHAGARADVRISVVRLTDGGAFALSAERAQLAWSTSPGLRIEGREYPELTCLYSPRDEDATIAGVDGVELFVIEFPRLD
jgi:hypothetical protein